MSNPDKAPPAKCLSCNAAIKDWSEIEWSIGHYKGMKTKTQTCDKCGKKTNWSKSVNGNAPDWIKGLM